MSDKTFEQQWGLEGDPRTNLRIDTSPTRKQVRGVVGEFLYRKLIRPEVLARVRNMDFVKLAEECGDLEAAAVARMYRKMLDHEEEINDLQRQERKLREVGDEAGVEAIAQRIHDLLTEQ